MSWPRPDRPRTLWVGAAGTGTAWGLVQTIRERWGGALRVIAADINPAHLVAASALADAYVQMPPVADAAFVPRLLDGLASHAVDVYVPILDEELVLGAELAEGRRLPAGTELLGPPHESARLCLDKLAMARWLRARGLPTPETVLPEDARWCGSPLLAKPRAGRGSIGVQRIESADDLRGLTGRDDVIVQPLCRGPEVTVDAFRSRHGGAVRAVCRERVETKAGVCTKARVFEDAELSEVVGAIGAGLDLRGVYCVQAMRAPAADAWMVTDVNPRPGAGTRMSTAAGVDVLAAGIADLWTPDAAALLPPLPHARWVVRHYTEVVF